MSLKAIVRQDKCAGCPVGLQRVRAVHGESWRIILCYVLEGQAVFSRTGQRSKIAFVSFLCADFFSPLMSCCNVFSEHYTVKAVNDD